MPLTKILRADSLPENIALLRSFSIIGDVITINIIPLRGLDKTFGPSERRGCWRKRWRKRCRSLLYERRIFFAKCWAKGKYYSFKYFTSNNQSTLEETFSNQRPPFFRHEYRLSPNRSLRSSEMFIANAQPKTAGKLRRSAMWALSQLGIFAIFCSLHLHHGYSPEWIHYRKTLHSWSFSIIGDVITINIIPGV